MEAAAIQHSQAFQNAMNARQELPKDPVEFERFMKSIALSLDPIRFSRYFFRVRDGSEFKVNDHHIVLSNTLQRVIDGEINRLIINIPPGYTKTEEAVIHFVARGLATNPRAKFIHTSYSQSLAATNSVKVRDVITSPEYQELWPMTLRSDAKGKHLWMTSAGGEFKCDSSGGGMTGFRAGRMEPGFTGAFIIDDPVKPDDAYSDAKRNFINNRFNNTFASRLAHQGVPYIVIMQRIHEDDMTGYLLKGGSGDYWHHLVMPALVPEEPREYPKKYTHGIPIEYDLKPGPLWPAKHTREQLIVMKETDPYTYSSQYDQEPAPLEGGIFKEKWWRYYAIDPDNATEDIPMMPYDIVMRKLFGDTAQYERECHDFSVFTAWAYHPKFGIFLEDMIRGKWEAPQLKANCVAFWNKHSMGTQEQNWVGAGGLYVEEKSSGIGLIQDLNVNSNIPVFGVPKNTSKLVDVMATVPYVASGKVWIPIDAPWTSDFMEEHRQFTPNNTHAHDDQIDNTVMAIKEMLMNPDSLFY